MKTLVRNRRAIITTAALVAMGVCGVCLAIAWFGYLQPPGVGAKAEAGYQRGKPIIEALDRYHTDHGSYPHDLQALVPDYLSSEQVAIWQGTGDGNYELADMGYQLSFNYIGPCANFCAYDPEAGKWSCSGFC